MCAPSSGLQVGFSEYVALCRLQHDGRLRDLPVCATTTMLQPLRCALRHPPCTPAFMWCIQAVAQWPPP